MVTMVVKRVVVVVVLWLGHMSNNGHVLGMVSSLETMMVEIVVQRKTWEVCW